MKREANANSQSPKDSHYKGFRIPKVSDEQTGNKMGEIELVLIEILANDIECVLLKTFKFFFS